MNLRVDLLLDSERRSGGRIRVRFLVRTAAILVPTIVLGIVFWIFWSFQSQRSKLKADEAYVNRKKPEYKEALRLKGQVARNLAQLAELKALSASRMLWHDQLLGLQKTVHPMIQLTRLRVAERLSVSAGTPVRINVMTLTGKATGDDPDTIFNRFKRSLEKDAVFEPVMDAVKVTRYDEASQDESGEKVRVFEIECRYKPRKVAKVAAEKAKK